MNLNSELCNLLLEWNIYQLWITLNKRFTHFNPINKYIPKKKHQSRSAKKSRRKRRPWVPIERLSFESKHFRDGDYFMIIASCKWIGRSAVEENVEKERFTVASSRCCHLADKVKELYSRACRTCSTIIFPHSTNQIIFSGLVLAVAVVLA